MYGISDTKACKNKTVASYPSDINEERRTLFEMGKGMLFTSRYRVVDKEFKDRVLAGKVNLYLEKTFFRNIQYFKFTSRCKFFSFFPNDSIMNFKDYRLSSWKCDSFMPLLCITGAVK